MPPGTSASGDSTSGAPLVSAITVNFNAGDDLVKGVLALLRSSIALELFVVDNGSTDESVARLRSAVGEDARVTILENGRNLGFAKANNRAIAKGSGTHLLLINPDCLVTADTLARMVEALDAHPEAGMAGPLILNPDGSEQVGCRRAEPTPWRTLGRAFGLQGVTGPSGDFVLAGTPLPGAPTAVDAISGAFMLVRKSSVATVGPLDEGYFLHCEDLDWCHRFRMAGLQVLFVPQVAVTHVKGRSSGSHPLRVLYYKHKGMARYYLKFHKRRYGIALSALVVAGVWLRFCALSLLVLIGRVRSS